MDVFRTKHAKCPGGYPRSPFELWDNSEKTTCVYQLIDPSDEMLKKNFHPSVIVSDLNIGGTWSGIDLKRGPANVTFCSSWFNRCHPTFDVDLANLEPGWFSKCLDKARDEYYPGDLFEDCIEISFDFRKDVVEECFGPFVLPRGRDYYDNATRAYYHDFIVDIVRNTNSEQVYIKRAAPISSGSSSSSSSSS